MIYKAPKSQKESGRSSITRCHPLKLMKQTSRVDSRAFSYANRSTDVWNSLDSDVVLASSLYLSLIHI